MNKIHLAITDLFVEMKTNFRGDGRDVQSTFPSELAAAQPASHRLRRLAQQLRRTWRRSVVAARPIGGAAGGGAAPALLNDGGNWGGTGAWAWALA